MQMETDDASEPAAADVQQKPNTDSASSRAARPIAELLEHPDFPKCAVGECVDIGGYVGIVVNVVGQSLKVRSPEGITKSFNAGGLRKLYGPRTRPGPFEELEIKASSERPTAPPAETPPPAPKREVIADPDFAKPVKNIVDLVGRADYPKCTYGEHVAIGEYVGVVVEIVNRSLKVRSSAETTRSYNADALRKLYGT
jgi:hypothetical protein